MDLVGAELNRHLHRQEKAERIADSVTPEDLRVARDELIDEATSGNGLYGTLETYLNVDGKEYLQRFGEVVRHFGDLIEGSPLERMSGETYKAHHECCLVHARVEAREWLQRIAAAQITDEQVQERAEHNAADADADARESA